MAQVAHPDFDYGLGFVEEDQPGYKTDAQIDLWHDGALDCYRGKPKASSDPDYLEGWAHAENERHVQVVMPARPEGYYHMPLGTFE